MSSVLIFSSNIKDAIYLAKKSNYDKVLKYISDNNKKYLLLKINIKINIYNLISKGIELKTYINFLIYIFLESFHNNINIYSKILNLIHFIIFNKMNIYDVLYFSIIIYYMKDNTIIINQHTCISTYYIGLEVYIESLYSIERYNYTDLLFNDYYNENNINKKEIMNKIWNSFILIDKINNLEILTDHNNKINDLNQLNIQNNNKIIILTKQNYYYYNKIKMYILNKTRTLLSINNNLFFNNIYN
uniref:Uncharacterized protein n=1 Tax=viral metagenome TaxID=1070528 RepID=A0A6C0H909_9ZZZZ